MHQGTTQDMLALFVLNKCHPNCYLDQKVEVGTWTKAQYTWRKHCQKNQLIAEQLTLMSLYPNHANEILLPSKIYLVDSMQK